MTVGIVGLGISGLRTAMLLEAAGCEVRLFEARQRPGGRLFTVTEGDRAVYEAGGEWLDTNDFRCLRLVHEAGLEPDLRGVWPRRVLFRNSSCSEDLLWSDAMEDELRVEAAARELSRNLRQPAWNNAHVAEWDERTLETFILDNTVSERGHWWVTANARARQGDDPQRIGLLGWLTRYLHTVDLDADDSCAYRIPGGFRALFERLISRLRATPEYGCVLERVTEDAGGVTLKFENGEARVDEVILTLAAPALERVVFEPPLSAEKRCALEACGMGRAVKIVWRFETAWWRDDPNHGSLLCDGPLQQVWDASLGEEPVLAATICGEDADRWLDVGDPVRAGLYELGRVFDFEPRTFVSGAVHNWTTDLLVRGSASHPAPGFVLSHMRHLATRQNRVRFAGEHTSPLAGTIEGALESAERVAGEITQETPPPDERGWGEG